MTDESGVPSYRSSVYKAVVENVGTFDLATVVSLLQNKEIYVSACFICKSFYVEDENARNALIAVEAAIIAEAANAGVDDIVICGLPVTDLGISYVARLFSEIRKLSSNAVLGASVNYDKVVSESGAAAIKDYSEFADFCAIDLSQSQNNGVSLEKSLNSLIYLFEVYPLRILMSISGSADFYAQSEILKSVGINNYQAYKYSKNSSSVG